MLDHEDVDLMLHEVERFCHSELRACVDYPETPVNPETLSVLTDQLEQLGILNLGAEFGSGLWEHSDNAAGMRFNIQTLRTMAAMSAGVAFHWHRIALAGWLLKQTGQHYKGTADGITLLTQGHYGLAREALPHWLTGTGMGDEQEAVMRDWLNNADQGMYVHVGPDWQAVLLPRWHHGTLQWSLIDRDSSQAEAINHAPGFDELACFKLAIPKHPLLSELSGQESRDCYKALLMLDAIGLMAIGLGSLERAERLAREYAHERRQGGTRIVEHPAVSLMLADIRSATQSSELQLEGLFLGLSGLDIARVMAVRAVVHPQLCRGADQAIQVHGGIGYMRDCGVEKVWREQQTLRRLTGTTLELRLFASRLELCA